MTGTPSTRLSTSPPPPPDSPIRNSFLSPPRRKERRNPSVTPRRFARFFRTPLGEGSSQYGFEGGYAGGGRVALSDVGGSTTNSQPTRVKRKLFDNEDSTSAPLLPPPEPLTKRTRTEPDTHPFSDENIPALSHRLDTRGFVEDDDLPSSPCMPSSPPLPAYDSENQRSKTLNDFWLCSRSGVRPGATKRPLRSRLEDIDMDSEEEEEEEDETVEPVVPAQPIRRFRETGLHSRLLARECGYSSRMGRSLFRYPAPDVHPDVAAFCSQSTDILQCNAFRNDYQLIPFSLAISQSQGKTVTAVGDEEGYVRFITRANGELAPRYFWQAHANAIMDLDWSPAGTHLATAAGDRSARVLDVHSQSPLVNLTGGHESCLRQVKFQPGSTGGHILATSDRSSKIQIWDTRYKRAACTIPEEVFVSPDGTVLSESASSNFGDPINTVLSAHSRKHENNNPASVTSLQWLHPGQSHLLLSASEADSTIKLWDTRYIGYTRDSRPRPLSSTAQPADHIRRPYGITSMALNTDASRLYAVCKNGAVYAYSTSHLVLGHGPELATHEPPRPRNGRDAAGLGPLYGFRHDRLKVNTFFIKCAVLPSSVTGTEMLAVGSSDSCPVLFPTDENAIRANWALNSGSPEDEPPSSQADAPQTPTVRNGTALVEGTSREVSSVKWTPEGDLVSLSDDYSIRLWGRDAERARFLRGCGDFGGERFGCGWADVGAEFDREDDESEVVDVGVSRRRRGRWW